MAPLLASVSQLDKVQLLGVLEKSHHLQTIIQCLHLEQISAPVTHLISVTHSHKHPKLIKHYN